MSKRIVTIAPTGFFADYGCHVRILEETRALEAAGHHVTIFTYATGSSPPGTRVRRIPALAPRQNPLVGSHWRKLLLDPVLSGTALARTLGRGVDIVHAHLHEGVLAGWPLAKLTGAPLVFDYQGSLTSEMLDHRFLRPGSPLLRVFGWIERLATRAPDRILTSSDHARDQLLERFGVAPERVTAVPDGVDLERFRPRTGEDSIAIAERRRRLGIPSDRLIVGYLGLLAEYQGTGDLIRAAERVVRTFPGAHFLIMGFPNPDVYAAAARTAGLERFFTFTGRVPYEDAPESLRVMDIAVSPKRSETEGNGKLLNYMATGLPTIAYDGAVAKEILGPSGVLARRASVGELADALIRLLEDRELRTRTGSDLRARAERHFAWSDRIRPVLDLYEEVTR